MSLRTIIILILSMLLISFVALILIQQLWGISRQRCHHSLKGHIHVRTYIVMLGYQYTFTHNFLYVGCPFHLLGSQAVLQMLIIKLLF